MNINNGMRTWIVPNNHNPCNDCFVTWIQAGLEYPDGTEANADTGLWLHHIVTADLRKAPLTCPVHLEGDRFFSSGNERGAHNICANGTEKAGYYIPPKHQIGALIELMNMHDTEQEAILTMTYEFVPGVPTGFQKAIPLWLDIADCSVLEKELPLKEGIVFDYDGPAWKSNTTYRIISNTGHLHDGGIHIETRKNGEVICDSHALYGETAGYLSNVDMAMDMISMCRMKNPGDEQFSKPDLEHLSSMADCTNTQKHEYILPGDELMVMAYYDLSQHTPMVDADCIREPIMGINWMYMLEVDANAPLEDVDAVASEDSKTPSATGATWISSATLITALWYAAIASAFTVVALLAWNRYKTRSVKGTRSFPMGLMAYRDDVE